MRPLLRPLHRPLLRPLVAVATVLAYLPTTGCWLSSESVMGEKEILGSTRRIESRRVDAVRSRVAGTDLEIALDGRFGWVEDQSYHYTDEVEWDVQFAPVLDWWFEDDGFPATSWLNDDGEWLFFLTLTSALWVCLAIDGVMIIGAGAADVVGTPFSWMWAPVSAPFKALDDGSENSEKLSRSASGLRAGWDLHWRVAGESWREARADDAGRIRLDLGEAAADTLSDGSTRMPVELALDEDGTKNIFARFVVPAPKVLALAAEEEGGTIAFGGEDLDWSAGEPSRLPRATVATEVVDGTVIAGQPMEMAVQVRNTGKGTLYRFLVVASSPFVDEPVLVPFGRIEPGQELSRRIELQTSVTSQPQDVDVELAFEEQNDYRPASRHTRFRIAAADSPNLKMSIRVIDDGSGESVGNADGVIQRDEAVDVHITVKNVGTGVARDATLELEMQAIEGVRVFGDRRFALGDLKPGQSRLEIINIGVKPSFAGSQIPLDARVSERSPFAISDSQDLTLEIDSRAPQKVIVLNRRARVTTTTALLNAASPEARSLGQVDGGMAVRATGELGQFVRIEYQADDRMKSAWIRLADMSFEGASGSGDFVRPAANTTATIREFVNAPPTVVLISPDEGATSHVAEPSVRVKAIVKDDGGIASWRIVLNGEVIDEMDVGSRGIRAKRPSGGETLVRLDERIELAPGANDIEVVAVDAQGTETRVAAVVDRSVRDARVVALVVGINDYQDQDITDLAYAEDDARAFAEFLRGPRSPVRSPDDVRLLLTPEASKSNIEKELSALTKRATHPEDMAILYFAGHGYRDGSRTYLAGADTELAELRATGLRASTLSEYWEDIGAQRKVFIADACHSGGIEGLRGENEVSSGLSGELSGAGTVSFMASSERQLSIEDASLGHGIFTYALIDGLNGAADGNRDGRVSAKELASHLDREVPAMAKGHAHQQTPTFQANTDGAVFLTR